MLGLHNFSGLDGECFGQVAPAKTSQPFGKEPTHSGKTGLCGGLLGGRQSRHRLAFRAILWKGMAL